MVRFQITIRATNVPKRKRHPILPLGTVLPNPYVIVEQLDPAYSVVVQQNQYQNQQSQQKQNVLGRSDIVLKSIDPNFCKVFFIETNGTITDNVYVPFQVRIYDNPLASTSSDDTRMNEYQYCSDSQHTNNNEQQVHNNNNSIGPYNDSDDVVAFGNFDVMSVYSSPGHTMMKNDDINTPTTNVCSIYVSVEESNKGNENNNGLVQLHIRGLELKNISKSLFGLDRSDPYYTIYRKHFDHTNGIVQWNPIYRSEYIINHLNPYWNSIHDTISLLTIEELCFNDMYWPIKISVYSYSKNKHIIIGEVETTVASILQHVSYHGNAHRDTAYKLHKVNEDSSPASRSIEYEKIRGYIVILHASILPFTTNTTTNTNTKTDSTTVYTTEIQQQQRELSLSSLPPSYNPSYTNNNINNDPTFTTDNGVTTTGSNNHIQNDVETVYGSTGTTNIDTNSRVRV